MNIDPTFLRVENGFLVILNDIGKLLEKDTDNLYTFLWDDFIQNMNLYGGE